jgi:glycerophosphoryl diester phosphodiesterase
MRARRIGCAVGALVVALVSEPLAYVAAVPELESGAAHSGCQVRPYAHRGTFVGAVHTENTVPAFREVIRAGGTGLETDLRVTKDGHFVFMHDVDVNRTTTGTGNVADLTLRQIQRIKTNDGGHIPTLKEALLAVRHYDVSMFIEVKKSALWNDDSLMRMAMVIRRSGMTDRVLLNAGSLSQVDLVRAGTNLRVLWKHNGVVDVRTVVDHADGLTAKPATRLFVRRLHAAGLVVVAKQTGYRRYAWWKNINGRRHAARPEGTMTNHIDQYARWCSRHQQ